MLLKQAQEGFKWRSFGSGLERRLLIPSPLSLIRKLQLKVRKHLHAIGHPLPLNQAQLKALSPLCCFLHPPLRSLSFLTENQSRVAMEGNDRELLLSFFSQPCQNRKWVINPNGPVREFPRVMLAEIRYPTRSLGWVKAKLQMAWKLIFP